MSNPLPICVTCRLEMRVVKNDRPVKDPASANFPSTYWFGDEYECQCGARIVTGFGESVEENPALAADETVLLFDFERPPVVALNRIRHDCADLFRLKLLPQAVSLDIDPLPCAVHVGSTWRYTRQLQQLLDVPDETVVLTFWPGTTRTDFFRFTVAEFRQAWEASTAEEGGGA